MRDDETTEADQPIKLEVIDVPGSGPRTVEPPTQTMTRYGSTPNDLIAYALERDTDVDKLERLMRLKMEWDAVEAEKAFNDAMARCKAELPIIPKDKRVHYPAKGGKVDYRHATLGCELAVVAPIMAKHGLSHKWSVLEQSTDGMRVGVTVRHVAGHSESEDIWGPIDTSPGKNGLQMIASTKSYLSRYVFEGIMGLAAAEDDDDGRGGPANHPSEDPEPRKPKEQEIGKRKKAAIEAFARHLGDSAQADLERFLDKPADQWEPVDVDKLNKCWKENAHKKSDEGALANLREVFGLEPGATG